MEAQCTSRKEIHAETRLFPILRSKTTQGRAVLHCTLPPHSFPSLRATSFEILPMTAEPSLPTNQIHWSQSASSRTTLQTLLAGRCSLTVVEMTRKSSVRPSSEILPALMAVQYPITKIFSLSAIARLPITKPSKVGPFTVKTRQRSPVVYFTAIMPRMEEPIFMTGRKGPQGSPAPMPLVLILLMLSFAMLMDTTPTAQEKFPQTFLMIFALTLVLEGIQFAPDALGFRHQDSVSIYFVCL
mmetsp:Transcript_24664/g.71119  ORF Transcript_24664/g.71119 Transcript_24664/m.71119 type:complete len:242 (-) Transcript_24664:204-929(-)